MALVEMVPTKPMVVEKFSEFPRLGIITIRDSKKIVGYGVIKDVQKKTKDAAKSKK